MLSSTGDPNESQPSTTTSSSIESSQQSCRRFEFSEILPATDNFDGSLVIGHGGFGKVYKGNIINGSTVSVAAIKRLDPMSGQGASEFWAKVEMLSNFRHPHLVSLFGYCNHEKEMILVYEYIPNGTLEDHLHKLGTPLSWFQRLKICIGAASGLHYLHNGTGNDVGVIHRDVKSSNILLHESWDAKISDFGLSKIGPTNQPLTYVNTRVKGTFGYLDPDYAFTGRLSRKSDVYAFGVVLLEVLCRKPALYLSLDDEEQNLARWVQESIKKGNLKHIIDSGIRDQISPRSLKEFVRIAGECLHNKQKERPTMSEVVFGLESLLTVQWKMSSSLQPSHRTILGRMIGKTRFGRTVASLPSNRENSGIPTFREDSLSCRKFEFREILLATNSFDESFVTGRGALGKVYKGTVYNGSSFAVAAIKQWNLMWGRQQGRFYIGIFFWMHPLVVILESATGRQASEFWVEVEMLSELHHDHLVSLFGYCNYEEEMFLIREYIPNGSLRDHLHKLGTPLSWVQRLKICIGAARGLDYLHTGMGTGFVIHGDVKTSHILLDDSWEAKISGFGLSRRGPMAGADYYSVMTEVKGSFGYFDPEYVRTSRLTPKSDVYSFGVVLLEVLCRKLALNFQSADKEEVNLTEWALKYIKKGNLNHIIDLGIRDQISPNCLKMFVQITEGCLQENSNQRPTMSEVMAGLESILLIQEETNVDNRRSED